MFDQKLIHLSTKVHVFSKLHYLNNYKCYTQGNAFVKLTSIFYERVEEFHCPGAHIVALSHNLLTCPQLEMIAYLLPGRIFIEIPMQNLKLLSFFTLFLHINLTITTTSFKSQLEYDRCSFFIFYGIFAAPVCCLNISKKFPTFLQKFARVASYETM